MCPYASLWMLMGPMGPYGSLCVLNGLFVSVCVDMDTNGSLLVIIGR